MFFCGYWQQPSKLAAVLPNSHSGGPGPPLFCLLVTLIEELHCAGQAKAVRKLQGKRLAQLQPLPQTLRAWALLQLDGTPRVSRVASARLAGAVRNRSFREKVRCPGQVAAPGHRCVGTGKQVFSWKSTKK